MTWDFFVSFSNGLECLNTILLVNWAHVRSSRASRGASNNQQSTIISGLIKVFLDIIRSRDTINQNRAFLLYLVKLCSNLCILLEKDKDSVFGLLYDACFYTASYRCPYKLSPKQAPIKTRPEAHSPNC